MVASWANAVPINEMFIGIPLMIGRLKKDSASYSKRSDFASQLSYKYILLLVNRLCHLFFLIPGGRIR